MPSMRVLISIFAASIGPAFAGACSANGTCPDTAVFVQMPLQRKKETAGSTLRQHPFVAEVLSKCKKEIRRDIMKANQEVTFYDIMRKLEAARDRSESRRRRKNAVRDAWIQKKLETYGLPEFKISKKCKRAAFGGTAAAPLKLLVTEITKNDADGNTFAILKAPLFYNKAMARRQPIHKTYFSYTPCRKQPAPMGMLFYHNGGPAPGLVYANALVGPSDNTLTEEQKEHIRENYDIVTSDQRGMGVSGLFAFKEDMVYTKTRWEDWRELGLAMKEYTGWMSGAYSVADLGNAPCTKLAEANPFYLPRDWGNMTQVKSYLDDKVKYTTMCFAKLEKNIRGVKYNLLQYMGTQSLAHDIEWMRWAFGSPPITLMGQSYGTRMAAAYSSMFPFAVFRVGVTGTMAPEPDALTYAKGAAMNSAAIIGFIQNSCAASKYCMRNPFKRGEYEESGFYFTGNTVEAMEELFQRSSNGGEWYTSQAGGKCQHTLPKHLMAEALLPLMGGDMGYQAETWPVGFAALPTQVYMILQKPCWYAAKLGKEVQSGWFSENQGITVFSLLPALDMVGRLSRDQLAEVITDYAKDPIWGPALNMFLLYVKSLYGFTLQPHPISYASNDVDTVIAEALYDDRTGMNFAQEYRKHFSKSSLITSQSGGHCVGTHTGVHANKLLWQFVLGGMKPRDGLVTGEPLEIDWKEGHNRYGELPLV
eukprot:TRINITY_DN47184_c0_g1_i1.p1 TRINITY_DN47184_c0_g1~~TRINITY_DN47184_c0_g1_i1.p1  ORF type:complete len:704 (+),score=88.89 TRINITY_DN47184_c0_g1_i1:66-2177(+)